MAKLTVVVPAPPDPADILAPQNIQRIWAEALRESEKESAVLYARRARRARAHQA